MKAILVIMALLVYSSFVLSGEQERYYLESFDFGALSFVSTLQRRELSYALLRDSTGGLHRLEIGDQVGRNHAILRRIFPDSVEFQGETEELPASNLIALNKNGQILPVDQLTGPEPQLTQRVEKTPVNSSLNWYQGCEFSVSSCQIGQQIMGPYRFIEARNKTPEIACSVEMSCQIDNSKPAGWWESDDKGLQAIISYSRIKLHSPGIENKIQRFQQQGGFGGVGIFRGFRTRMTQLLNDTYNSTFWLYFHASGNAAVELTNNWQLEIDESLSDIPVVVPTDLEWDGETVDTVDIGPFEIYRVAGQIGEAVDYMDTVIVPQHGGKQVALVNLSIQVKAGEEIDQARYPIDEGYNVHRLDVPVSDVAIITNDGQQHFSDGAPFGMNYMVNLLRVSTANISPPGGRKFGTARFLFSFKEPVSLEGAALRFRGYHLPFTSISKSMPLTAQIPAMNLISGKGKFEGYDVKVTQQRKDKSMVVNSKKLTPITGKS